MPGFKDDASLPSPRVQQMLYPSLAARSKALVLA
jgi:hypothetical protein